MSSNRLALSLATATLLVSASGFAAPVGYTVDKDHSKIGFSVRHMMISNVTGNFKDFDGSFTFDAAKDTLIDGKFEAKTASINTDNVKRDEHLKSADFFDAAKYPTITFTDTKLKKVSKDKYKWSGTLTMHGVSKPVTFDLEKLGTAKDPWGNMRAGFAATTKVKRGEWGLNWNKALETGGLVVSDDVTLDLSVEAVEAKAPGAAAPAAAAATPAAASATKKK